MSLWTPFLWLAIILPILIIAHLKSEKTNLKYLLIFIIYFLFDCYLNSLDFIDSILPNLKWNWDGKFLSLILSLGFILFHSKEIQKDIGFTTKFKKKRSLGF